MNKAGILPPSLSSALKTITLDQPHTGSPQTSLLIFKSKLTLNSGPQLLMHPMRLLPLIWWNRKISPQCINPDFSNLFNCSKIRQCLIHQVSVVCISRVSTVTSKHFNIRKSPRLFVLHPVNLLPVNGHRVVNLESDFLVAKATLELAG